MFVYISITTRRTRHFLFIKEASDNFLGQNERTKLILFHFYSNFVWNYPRFLNVKNSDNNVYIFFWKYNSWIVWSPAVKIKFNDHQDITSSVVCFPPGTRIDQWQCHSKDHVSVNHFDVLSNHWIWLPSVLLYHFSEQEIGRSNSWHSRKLFHCSSSRSFK